MVRSRYFAPQSHIYKYHRFQPIPRKIPWKFSMVRRLSSNSSMEQLRKVIEIPSSPPFPDENPILKSCSHKKKNFKSHWITLNITIESHEFPLNHQEITFFSAPLSVPGQRRPGCDHFGRPPQWPSPVAPLHDLHVKLLASGDSKHGICSRSFLVPCWRYFIFAGRDYSIHIYLASPILTPSFPSQPVWAPLGLGCHWPRYSSADCTGRAESTPEETQRISLTLRSRRYLVVC